jgi:hypothetical protein
MNFKKYIAPNGALFWPAVKLQIGRAYGANSEVMESFYRLITIALPLAIVSACLLGYVLHSQSGIFREFQAVLLSVQWMLMVCLAVWCSTFIVLTFSLNDLPFIGLLLIAIAAYFIGNIASWQTADATILLAGITLGKGTRFALMEDGRWKMEDSGLVTFLVGLIVLLAFSSFWHLDMTNNYYHGPRWMGLWDNPNIYGMLMGTGGTLAIGLLAANKKLKIKNVKFNRFLGIALFMMGVGLVMSYSRGAWVATTMGLLYLAWSYGKLKWRWVLTVILVAAAVVCVFWHSTADDGPWYLKRLDFSRPSAQHRVSAWRGAVQMMRDHPLGVGWNHAVETYDKNYSPPEDGAAAITMNSYLMLGTELGLPGLLCFVSYVALALKQKSGVRSQKSESFQQFGIRNSEFGIKTACRASALVLLVAFWFDGGLFELPTAAVFWILLELGAARGGKVESGELMVDSPKVA